MITDRSSLRHNKVTYRALAYPLPAVWQEEYKRAAAPYMALRAKEQLTDEIEHELMFDLEAVDRRCRQAIGFADVRMSLLGSQS